MKSLTFYSIGLLLIYCSLMGQSKYFQKGIAWDVSHRGDFVAELNDTTYLVAGDYTNLSDTSVGSYTLFTNQYGDTLTKKTYNNPEGNLVTYQVAITENRLALAGCISFDSIENGCFSTILFTDKEGSLLDLKRIGNTDYFSESRSIIATPDRGYLLAGLIIPYDVSPLLWEAHLIKVDSLGTTEWEKIYDDYEHLNAINRIIAADDGGYYLMGTVNLSFNEHTGDILLMKIDALGNKEWDRIYSIGEEDQGVRCIQTMDGGFLLSCGFDRWDSGVMKLDADYNIEWIKQGIYANCGLGPVLQLANGDFVVSGCVYNPFDYVGSEMVIIKLAPNGDILWERRYGDFDDDYGYDIVETSDGSLLVSGRTEFYSNAAIYLVKTNCMGLLTEPQASFSAFPTSFGSATIEFTNFSQYVYPDSTDGGHYIWDFGDGMSSNEAQPTHTYTADGIYTATLYAIVCSDTSTLSYTLCIGTESTPQAGFSYVLSGETLIFENLTSYVGTNPETEQVAFEWDFGDGTNSTEFAPLHTYTENGTYEVILTVSICGESSVYSEMVEMGAVGIEVATSIFSVSPFYPNPATQTANMIYDLGMEKAVLQVYDVTGRLLKSVDLKGQGSFEMDLTNWVSGVYFYQVILASVAHDFNRGRHNSRAILREKLVVLER